MNCIAREIVQLIRRHGFNAAINSDGVVIAFPWGSLCDGVEIDSLVDAYIWLGY